MSEETPSVTDAGALQLEALQKIQASLDALNSAAPRTVIQAVPPAAPAEGATPAPNRSPMLTASETFAMRHELRQRSTDEIYAMFSEQASKQGMGIPFHAWLSAGGNPLQAQFGVVQSQMTPEVQKLLDTSGATAIIRNDLDPFLWEMFIRLFPAWERFSKEPANGLVHTYMRATSFGDAEFMSELGTVTDDKSTYERATTNVAILATRRGVTLKSQFAATQGMPGAFNPEQLELQGGLRAMSHKLQKTIFQGNATDSGGDADNELGAYDPNGFTGLRQLLNTVRVVNADVSDADPLDRDDMRAKINAACVEIMGTVSSTGPVVAYLDPTIKEIIDEQQDKNIRYVNTNNTAVGINVNAINTVFGELPLFTVPGDSIGSYEADSNSLATDGSESVNGATVKDIYLVDHPTISMPYLGTPGPTVLDIPIGISGQLTHLFIIFGMWGLAVKSPLHSNKVRVKVAS